MIDEISPKGDMQIEKFKYCMGFRESPALGWGLLKVHFDGLAPDCHNSIANALELQQSAAKLSLFSFLW